MALNTGMDSLIRVVNQMHDASTQLKSALPNSKDITLGIQLPQIAVVGSQSVGKSSVLENFVGRDFLPRGKGIVTRRPLVLQLIHSNSAEYGMFLHQRDKKIYDFNEILLEIERETVRITGTNKGISDIPINLRIYSPHVLDLTLVDLPGMTRVAIGDQPTDIEFQIRDMILNYISNENCLILAVSSANTDLANSDALKLAKQVDPDGVRTIGVLTKLDLMDEGTDARPIIDNKFLPLRFGYIGVVNRSQHDIDSKKRIEQALEKERRFFLTHPAYRDVVDRLGCAYLQKTLNAHLTRHIAEKLPALRGTLMQQLTSVDEEIAKFDLQFDTENDKFWKQKAMVITTINFADSYKVELFGQDDSNLSTDKLTTGAHIRHIFHVKFPILLNSVEFTDELILKRKIGFAIENAKGVGGGIFTPDEAFRGIIKRQIILMRDPVKLVIKLISELLMKSLNETISASCGKFPMLERELEGIARGILLEAVGRTYDAVETLIEYELAYINAKHEDFIGFDYGDQPRSRTHKEPTNVPIKKGFLNTGRGLKSNRLWFVLSCKELAWYSDDTEQSRLYGIAVSENIKFADGRGNRVFLMDRNGSNVYKDQSRLDLLADSEELLEEWKVCFLNVGIFPIALEGQDGDLARRRPTDDEISDLGDSTNPHLRRQIETIFVLVDSYISIVRRNLQDLVPKCIVYTLLKHVSDFYRRSLIADLSARLDADTLMERSPDELLKLETLRKTRDCCKTALDIIQRVNLERPLEYAGAKSAPIKVNGGSQAPHSSRKPAPPPKPAPPRKPDSIRSVSTGRGVTNSMTERSNEQNRSGRSARTVNGSISKKVSTSTFYNM